MAASFADCLDRQEAYTPASLKQADDSVSGYHRLACLGMLKPEWEAAAIDLAQRAGCYLGEVIIRNLGGRWRPAKETAFAKLPGSSAFRLMVELPNGHCCNPLARPFKLLERGREEESMEGFYLGIESLAREPAKSSAPPRSPWWKFWS